MSLDTWAVDNLSILIGLDSETLRTQVLPQLLEIETSDLLAEHLMSMLGTGSDALDFIQEFTRRRFAAKPNQEPVQKRSEEQQNFPALASLAGPNATPFQKSEPDSFFFGVKAQKAKKKKIPRSESSQGASSAAGSTSERTEKKKKNEMTLESALKELDIQAGTGGKRKPCACQATKHPLLTIAPNCLNCGKIICTAEGPGPCTFCGTPVLSKEQQIALVAEAKKKRAEEKQRLHDQQQQRKGKAAQTPTVRYAAKVSGDFSSGLGQTSIWDSAKEEEELRRAESHKEKLLEFQRTSAKRSTVIDQATDFVLPTDQSNPWLSPQEKALEMKKQQANLKRLQDDRNRRRVLTVDLQSRRATVQEITVDSESDDEIPQPVIPRLQKDDDSAGTYANNPLLKGIQPPRFRGKQAKGKGAHQARKQRVQYDDLLI